MSAAKFCEYFNVSRETIARLEIYEELLRKWNPAINLVSSRTLEQLWTRHFIDSAQLDRLAAPRGRWADLGSGGGFPGLVVAILRSEDAYPSVTLVESDARKVAFLETVLRATGVSAAVLHERIEAVPGLAADVVSARALAALPKLLSYAARHLDPDGTALFLKGESWRAEIEASRQDWSFDLETVASITDPQSVVLVIKGIARA